MQEKMESGNISNWVQIAATVGVIVGIALVVVELRQAKALSQAETTTQFFAEHSQNARALMGENPGTILYLLALLASGKQPAAQLMLDNFTLWSKQEDSQGLVCQSVGEPLARGMELASRSETNLSVEAITPVRTLINDIGGSKAQADLFHMLHLDNLRHADTQMARGLFKERVEQNPKSSWSWRGLGESLKDLGDHGGAKRAAEEVLKLTS